MIEFTITKDLVNGLKEAFVLKKEDVLINRMLLEEEEEKQAYLYSYYADIFARLGKYKTKAELQVKRIRATVALEYRKKIRPTNLDKITDPTIKELVEVDSDVQLAEEIATEVAFLFSRVFNRITALEHKRDMIKLLHHREY